MCYSENKHKHNFSVWAASRAAQRGFAKVKVLKNALENSEVVKYAIDPPFGKDVDYFDKCHIKWCTNICDYLNEKGVQNVSYGRSAKLVGVYLKSMIVLPNLSSEQAIYIHPPIDRILLKNLAKKSGVEKEIKKYLNKVNWTQLKKSQYFDLIEVLREINGSAPFWMIEKYWEVTNE